MAARLGTEPHLGGASRRALARFRSRRRTGMRAVPSGDPNRNNSWAKALWGSSTTISTAGAGRRLSKRQGQGAPGFAFGVVWWRRTISLPGVKTASRFFRGLSGRSVPRLLVAALQRRAAGQASLDALGRTGSTGWSRTASRGSWAPSVLAEAAAPLQVFFSPPTLTRGAERTVGRPALRAAPRPLGHEARPVGADDDIQSTIRRLSRGAFTTAAP